MIKRFLIAIVLLVLIGGGLVGFNMFRDQAIQDFFANMPVQTVTVSTTEATPGVWTPSILAIGTVGANRGVELTVETTGIVRDLNFSANEVVEAGVVLVQLDDVVQQADLAAALLQADLDRKALERARELQQRGVGSAVALQAAEAAAAASASQVEKLEAVVQQKQLRAPFAGTLGIPRVELGQFLSPGTPVVTLQDLETMRVDFTVPEQQLGLLERGQALRLTLDGVEGTFDGTVTGIDPRVDPTSRLVSVRASITNPEGRLTPGQFARIVVVLPEEDDVIALPQTAIVTSLYGDHVYAVNATGEGEEAGHEVRQKFVTVGRRSGQRVEIVEGVAAGDVIVTAGQNRLSNGAPVTIDNTVNPADAASGQSASR